MNKPTYTAIKRADGSTLVFNDDREGRCIALFDDQGRNLQHINLGHAETRQLQAWVNEIAPKSSCRQLWPELYGKARAKGYEVYCGRYERQFSILGHADGWPRDFFATYDEIVRAISWLNERGCAVSEDERIERRSTYWEERKLIEALPEDFDAPLTDEEEYVPDEEDEFYEDGSRAWDETWDNPYAGTAVLDDGY